MFVKPSGEFQTPEVTVVQSRLVDPRSYTNKLKDGGTKVVRRFELKVKFDTPENEEHTAFTEQIRALEEKRNTTTSVVKPRTVKNQMSGEFEDHPSNKAITFRSTNRPLVAELAEGQFVLSDNADIPRGSKVVVSGEFTQYDFNGKSGLSAVVREVRVVSRNVGESYKARSSK